MIPDSLIRPPEWKTGGCLAERSIRTPLGWLGTRHDGYDPNRGWTVTGVRGEVWGDLGSFDSAAKAEAAIVEMYREQGRALAARWLNLLD